ncbi:MAG: type II toxin-antitoxin system VapC family toxin [Egibacteraceae bacterium]
MPAPIFVDTNVPIYAAGRPHPLKNPCREVLGLISEYPERFVTSAEVLQELLHRYLALRMWPQGRALLYDFVELMEERVAPVFVEDVRRAAVLADGHAEATSARDLLHVAVMKRLGAEFIASADRGFDGFPEVRRLDPGHVATWGAKLVAE